MSSLNSYQEIDIKINFNKYWQALKRRGLLAAGVFVGVVSFTSVYIAFNKPVYKSSGSILIEQPNSSFAGLETLSKGELETLGKQSDPLITEIEIIRSHPVLKETLETLSTQGSEIDISSLVKGIEVEPLPGTDMLTVSYQASDPVLATTVASTIIDVYKEINVRNNRAEASSAIKFIEAQLPRSAEAVRQAEQRLRAFKEENEIFILDKEASQSVTDIAKLESMIAEAEVQLSAIDSEPSGFLGDSSLDLMDNTGAGRLNLPPDVVEVAERYGQIKNQLTTERNRYSSEHPAVTALEKEEAQIKAQIQQAQLKYTQVQRQSLERQINKLSKLRNTMQAKINNFPRLEQTKRELERNLSASQVTYESLLNDLQKVRVVENQTIANVQVVSPPQVPERPDEINQKIILISGCIFASLLALATAFTVDLLDSSVKDIEHVQNLVNSPLIGIIPYYSRFENQLLLPSFDTNPKAEIGRVFTDYDPLHVSMINAYSSLWKRLSSNTDEQSKLIVVTSSVAGEGKSEVAANLAVACARSGKRVLLVDAARHRPTQHKIWSLPNTPGLGEVIENKVKLKNTVCEIQPNLFFLSSGGFSENNIDGDGLLNINARLAIEDLEKSLQAMSNDYDVKIFDTSSITQTMETSWLSKIADHTLLVVRPNKVDASNIKVAEQIYSSLNFKSFGIVVNAVNQGDFNKYFSLYNAKPRQSSPSLPSEKNSKQDELSKT